MEHWSPEEIDIISRYFRSNCSIISLHVSLQRAGYRRSIDAIRCQIHKMRTLGGYEKLHEIAERDNRIGYLDIEATNLNADFGVMLCWYIKEGGKKKYYHGLITEKELHERSYDKRIVTELLKACQNFDVIYTHYGSDRRFDIPYIRTRALIHKVDPRLLKVLDDNCIRDTWLISRNKLRLSSNRLERLQHILGVKAAKTALSPAVWIDAMYGSPSALRYIDKHCKADVDVLEQVHKRIEPVEKKSYVRMR